MRKPIESPEKARTKETRKLVANWMQLEIAPLISQRMHSRKPLPGTGR